MIKTDEYWIEQIKILQEVIADDRAEIELMKCCGNCENAKYKDGIQFNCKNFEKCKWADNYDYWELKESE